MSKKRRGFDIDLEGDLASDLDGDLASDLDSDLNGEDRSETDTNMAESQKKPAPVTPVRRGPMASAIHETAGSLRARAVVEAQIRAENDALAHEHVRLKALGLITDLIGLDLIDTWKLTRDRARPRAGLDDREMEELASSIREVGLSNPIRVEAQPDGRYELVQGFRRLQAYRALLAETDDAARFGTIPAVIIAQGDTLERLYRQMVDENMVRKDISFAEMAQMAIHYAMDPGTTETDPDKVVAQLFGSASYSKRSYIRRFIRVIEALGENLLFASEIPRNLGLALSERLEIEPETARMIRVELKSWGDNRGVCDELDVLRRYTRDVDLDEPTRDPSLPALPRVPFAAPPRGFALLPPVAGGTKLSFQLRSAYGPVQCNVANGRIELRLNRDLAQFDRDRLEAAAQALLDRLG